MECKHLCHGGRKERNIHILNNKVQKEVDIKRHIAESKHECNSNFILVHAWSFLWMGERQNVDVIGGRIV